MVPAFKKNICVFYDVISHIDLVNIWKNAHFSSLFDSNDSYMIRNLNYNCSLQMTSPLKEICVFYDVISHIDLVNIWKNRHFSSLFGLNDSYVIRNLNYNCSLLMTFYWWWYCTGLICYFVFWRRQYGKNPYCSCLICLFDSQMWWDPYNKSLLAICTVW